MKRIYNKIPVASILDHINPYTGLIIVDDKLNNGKPVQIFSGLVRDFNSLFAVTSWIPASKVEKAEVRTIIPKEKCIEIHIDTRYEEF